MERFPLQYIDGPDYCTVKDATGAYFALTVQPNVMKLMEKAFVELASALSLQKSAPERARSLPSGEIDPAVMSDSAGADTSLALSSHHGVSK
ncbi:MAG: hypothetical protein WC807_14750 [Hyphomicrobium sp.]|jgi:hypothetical protein